MIRVEKKLTPKQASLDVVLIEYLSTYYKCEWSDVSFVEYPQEIAPNSRSAMFDAGGVEYKIRFKPKLVGLTVFYVAVYRSFVQ